jgi:hypothetical protein
MLKTIPVELASTYKLLQTAFPDGVREQEYLPLLSVLYDEMADRSLAQVIADCLEREYHVVLNDIYQIGSEICPPINEDDRNVVQQKLIAAGYQDWLTEA